MIEYNQLQDLGLLDSGDYLPSLRPPFTSGKVSFADLSSSIMPYKKFVALISQAGTDAPTAVVLENNLIDGLIWSFDRDSAGNYNFYSGADIFTAGYTLVFWGNNEGGAQNALSAYREADDRLSFACYNTQYNAYQDSGIYNATFEVRVYNAPL